MTAEKQSVDAISAQLALKSKIIDDFLVAYAKTTDGIAKHISRLLMKPPEAEYFTNPNKILQEYMSKFDKEESIANSAHFSALINV